MDNVYFSLERDVPDQKLMTLFLTPRKCILVLSPAKLAPYIFTLNDVIYYLRFEIDSETSMN